MRAGCFAEDRVIDLVNRRFIPFYYCTGGPGLGHDDAAKEFVSGKTGNPWAFLAVFDPDGRILGESELYADKVETFEFLHSVLGEHSENDRMTEAEAAIVNAGAMGDASPVERLAAARLYEELGRYDAASRLYSEVQKDPRGTSAQAAAEALLGLLRIHRHGKVWSQHAAVEAALRAIAVRELKSLLADADTEAGYRLIATGEFARAREVLQQRALVETRNDRPSRRLGEIHFNAGVACWRLGDRDWAKFHWCWVAENMPQDRLCRRAYVAAAAESMPYPNAELGGFKGERGGCSIADIEEAYREARTHYEGLRALFAAARLDAGSDGASRGIDREDDPRRSVRETRR